MQRLTKGFNSIDLEYPEESTEEPNNTFEDLLNEAKGMLNVQDLSKTSMLKENQHSVNMISDENLEAQLLIETTVPKLDKISQIYDTNDGELIDTQDDEKSVSDPVVSFLRCHPYEMSESSSRYIAFCYN